MSLPLRLPGRGEVLGSLNVYAHSRDAFDPAAQEVGERFASFAAVAVHNARRLDREQRRCAELALALSDRAKIDQALGLLMARLGVGPPAALERLRVMSAEQGRSMAVLAEELVAATSPRSHRPS